jgi:hypothetical protein
VPVLHLLHFLWHGGINPSGIVMVAVSFGLAFLAQQLVGALPEGVLMMIAGPQIIALDLYYRSRRPEKNWWSFRQGGSLLFLPAWQLGAIWFVLGICYVIGPNLRGKVQ